MKVRFSIAQMCLLILLMAIFAAVFLRREPRKHPCVYIQKKCLKGSGKNEYYIQMMLYFSSGGLEIYRDYPPLGSVDMALLREDFENYSRSSPPRDVDSRYQDLYRIGCERLSFESLSCGETHKILLDEGIEPLSWPKHSPVPAD